jgi:hypothetical protein
VKLTIAYLTFRLRPRFEWFCSSLAREFRSTPGVPPDEVQVVVIDGRLWYDSQRGEELVKAAAGRIAFEHHPPKPSPWQGPSRQTQRDYFCAASVRNTAFAYSKAPHIAFVDDLSVLLPGWLEAHLKAARDGHVLAGTTCKNRSIVVSDDGTIVSYDTFPPGQDGRIKLVAQDGQACTGQWLYGGTFSVPLAYALAVNGQDEVHDTIGGEDYDFGIRLERAGAAIKISKSCGTFEDEDGHHSEASVIRLDKPWPGPDGPYSSNFLLNKLLREKERFWTVGNDYKLRDVHEHMPAGLGFPKVASDLKHWVDSQLLSEM